MKTVLEVRDVKKVFGEGQAQVTALHGVDLTLEYGEFVVIMGASGSGKSTFLHILGGLESPTSGEILLSGAREQKFDREPYATQYRREKIGFVFQFFNLLSALTAEENVALPLLLAGASKKELRERAQEMLRRVGLSERRTHRPSEMSGGQQQRVALARALVHRPQVLLADEPTGNLDSQTSAEMLELLLNMRAELGQSIVLVTHDPMVATYGDRVLFFRDGKIVREHRNGAELSQREKAFALMDQLRDVTEVGAG
ncbi:putative ABC transport system ATP-binding protein [Tumebacillus sp. BK434]|uniref:ABC transporter ATP-binding protein n=1 Tax=Tumebacillus sp. BK434 TaxID=2512169 RepID=UPI0010482F1A|nr:ABC transporter ATP-binding protein [Tumebacillus sp. BK434]TCP52769.1 putative ABC transport system ATP-binding protein [Tumebacillus sp. BK434]